MGTLKSISRDPVKSLIDIEEELGGPGSFLREMNKLGGEVDEWKAHLPSSLAATYFEDSAVQGQFHAHVDSCDYCQRLLDAMHPSRVESALFANHASGLQTHQKGKVWPTALAAGVGAFVLVGAMSLFAVPRLQMAGVLKAPDFVAPTWSIVSRGETARVIDSLRQHPGRLVTLEMSDRPYDRYEAASYYFAVDKPQLAYQQIGQGLRLAGVHAADAQRITQASDLPADSSSAQDIAKVARELPQLAASARASDPADYLEIAEAQAKLGQHARALVAIQQYLKATNANPSVLEDFSKGELANSLAPR